MGRCVGKITPPRTLNPFLDASGIIRVGGRLHKARLPYNQQHPTILPKDCHLALLIIDRALATLHEGQASPMPTQSTTSGSLVVVLRLGPSFDVVSLALTPDQLAMMGALPAARVRISRPFARTGLDYAGPFILKATEGCGVLTTKGYLAVFVCLSIKAVHLEVVGDLTAASFLAALRRFRDFEKRLPQRDLVGQRHFPWSRC